MLGSHSTRRERRHACWLLPVCLCVALGVGQDASGQIQQIREYPPQGYYLAFEYLHEGEFVDGLRTFKLAGQSGIRSTEGRWVDSICYHTMMGECLYHMGEIRKALNEYTLALQLFVQYPQWMIRVDFDPLQPSPPLIRPPTWGVSGRRAVLGRFPDRYRILQGRLDNLNALVQGGIIALPEYIFINAHEVARCTALSIRRRRELMGAACRHDPLTSQVFQALSTRPTKQNHWSQAWIDVQLGMAAAASGRVAQAIKDLGNGTLAGGTFDHPLTAMALLELGKLAFEQEQYGSASNAFHESSLSAAAFHQHDVVEEALRWGAKTHLVTGQQVPYPALNAAAAWAHRESRFLEASLLVAAAENAVVLNQSTAAVNLAKQARRRMERKGMLAGEVGARLLYASSLVNYQNGKLQVGDAEFASLMKYQAKGSRRLLEIELVDSFYRSGAVSDRIANQLFAHALREPTSADWTTDPVETQSVLMAPLTVPLEDWLVAALQRREYELALEIADRIRRHRFHSTLPMGGRLLSLRWVMSGPNSVLTERATLQRQAILEQFPRYGALASRADALRAQLDAGPLDALGSATRSDLARGLSELAAVSAEQELVLRQIALRRAPAVMAFPPQLDFKTAQASLKNGQMVLAFLNTSRGTFAFHFGRDTYSDPWPLAASDQVGKGTVQLLRGLGLLDRNQAIDIDLLRGGAWREHTDGLFQRLMGKVAFDERLKELIIVPDGMLWYLPFEALPFPGGSGAPLLSRIRVRYAPTVGLAFPDKRRESPVAETVVAAGKLFPRDDQSIAVDAAQELADQLPRVTTLTQPPNVASSVFATLFDRLVVFSDIEDSGRGPYGWSPLQIDRAKLGSTLSDWMALPWGGPQQAALPGFHTSAEVSLKDGGNGQHLFLSLCGLMSDGTRTVLISRWRPGGQSSYDLVREFVQELPYLAASDAWQRSVQLVMESELLLEREPRVRFNQLETGLRGNHPFFWAGFLLVDTGSAPVSDSKAETRTAAGP